MTQLIVGLRSGYFTASQLWERYFTDPARLVTVALTVLVLGYGSRIENGSPFILPFLETIWGVSFTGIELVMLTIFVMEVVRRLMLGDYMLDRSRLVLPMLWVLFVLGAVPYIRMIITENGFRFPLELLETPWLVGSFFIWLFVYRREDLHLMVWMVMIAGLYKSIEGVAVYLRVGLGWGLLTGWRDAMLLMMTVMGAFFCYVIKPEGDLVYRRVRLFFLGIFPLSMFSFIGSSRRSYAIGAVISIFVLLFYFRRHERGRIYGKAIPLLIVLGGAAMAVMGSTQLIGRLAMASEVGSESSAAYRLIELYNISLDVMEKPIFGWPMGKSWTNYTLLEVERQSNVMPHNTYLYMLWRGGIIGLLFWLWMLWVLVRMHHRTIRAARTPMERFMAFWLASGTIAVLFATFTMPISADRLKNFYPFIMVMTSFLPGAWGPIGSRRLQAGSSPEPE
jgi:O-antigen ligase